MTYKTMGYTDLELSTQILIKEAVKRNIGVEVMDAMSNTIRLDNGQKKEIVMQATRTSKDNYIAPLLMTNKHLTKLLLSEQKINVPKGYRITAVEEGLSFFHDLESLDVVIKPLSTNYGQGITILNEGYTYDAFRSALAYAFDYDTVVLIEEYVEGREYRIMVIDGKVIAALHRVPANVVGDGLSSIRELVHLKNQDPLRGIGYVKPLEKIKLGKIEIDYLKEQGYDQDSVPEKGESIFLRINSNISTGGDSIDYTDDIDPRYYDIAVKAAESVGAKVCGVDMIIHDINAYDETGYSIIELNFNPAIHIHDYPYKGENRKVENAILSLLGF